MFNGALALFGARVLRAHVAYAWMCRIAACENNTHPNRHTSDVRPRCANAMHYWCGGTRPRGSTSDPHSYRRVRLCDHERARPARATTSVARRRSALGLRRTCAFLKAKGCCSAYSRDMSPNPSRPLRRQAPPHLQRSARLPAHPLPPTNPTVETSTIPCNLVVISISNVFTARAELLPPRKGDDSNNKLLPPPYQRRL